MKSLVRNWGLPIIIVSVLVYDTVYLTPPRKEREAACKAAGGTPYGWENKDCIKIINITPRAK